MIHIFELCVFTAFPFTKKSILASPTPAVATNVMSTTHSTVVCAYPIRRTQAKSPKTKRTTKHTYKHATLPQLLLFPLSIYHGFIYRFLYV